MARDITTLRNTFGSTVIPFLGLKIEQLILLLYPLLLIPAAYLWFNDLRRRRLSVTQPTGCKRLGVQGKSNAEDEYDSKYSQSLGKDEWKIKALFIHPIKSCAPLELDVADVEVSGLRFDRIFAFAEHLAPATGADKTPRWTFRTQRQPGYEKLSQVKVDVWVPVSATSKQDLAIRRIEKEGAVVVTYPNVPSGPLAAIDRFMISIGLVPAENSFKCPLTPPEQNDYPLEAVNIWTDTPTWLNFGRHVPDDFRRWIGTTRPFTLFRVDPKTYREVYRCAPRKEAVGYQPIVGFQDAYPVNLMNLASVHDVGTRVKDAIPRFSAKRFRMNILLTGPPAYDEDDWKRIKVGGHELYCACHTVRCRLPNVDPDTADRHPVEPDKTLKSFRCIDEGDPRNACLGLQLVPASTKTTQLRVGDRVEILERGEHFYIKQGH